MSFYLISWVSFLKKRKIISKIYFAIKIVSVAQWKTDIDPDYLGKKLQYSTFVFHSKIKKYDWETSYWYLPINLYSYFSIHSYVLQNCIKNNIQWKTCVCVLVSVSACVCVYLMQGKNTLIVFHVGKVISSSPINSLSVLAVHKEYTIASLWIRTWWKAMQESY